VAARSSITGPYIYSKAPRAKSRRAIVVGHILTLRRRNDRGRRTRHAGGIREDLMSVQPTLDLSMADLIDGWPAAARVLARHGMACVGCGMARFETIAEATAAYGVDSEAFLQEISRAGQSLRHRPAYPRAPRRPRRRGRT
jgi:hybrid cluster-associated redox disulfide protein